MHRQSLGPLGSPASKLHIHGVLLFATKFAKTNKAVFQRCPEILSNGRAQTVYITNALNDAIVVHIKSTDHDLENHTIPSNGVYSWTFCQKIIGSHFHGYFWWGTRYQNLALIDKELMILCRDDSEIADQFCYWMVVPDGFFVSGTNYTFPDNWVKKKGWDY
ncbi:hypothetical protein R6Q57_010897 [Mikania cordata]